MTEPPARPPSGYRDLWSLAGEAYVIVGAGGGMGLHTARAFADLGARLLLVDRDGELAERAAAETGGVAVRADATGAAALGAALDLAVATFGRIDGAVDVVGGASRTTIDGLHEETWDRDMRVNLRHAYLLGHLLGPRLAAQGSGSLTFIASVSASYGSFVTPAYAAAKAALVNWVQSLAITYGPAGVRANTVSPGTTHSERMARVMGEEGVAGFASRTALKEINRPDDVAAAIAFLASPAARMITGHDLVVDGGTRARDPWYGDRGDASFADDVL